MEVRKIHISKMNPAVYNPRKVLTPDDPQYQSLKHSIEEFGYVEPIVWNERSGNIVGGHRRFDVMAAEGIEEFDVSVVDLDDTREKALNIALNKISGEWDEEKLTDILVELSGEGMIDFTGFTTMEVSELLGDTVEFQAGTDPVKEKTTSFSYQEQYGVIVICNSEGHQQEVYMALLDMGYECKVVAT